MVLKTTSNVKGLFKTGADIARTEVDQGIVNKNSTTN